ncbi:ABC transporter substrate-binding protein [Pseudorhodoferax sp.]|uniref:ABC transporter substrate-binding protein n=1 Tax=Pseudorhodoferax sp. TaxID=1993553 RepID=UPI0039E44C6C
MLSKSIHRLALFAGTFAFLLPAAHAQTARIKGAPITAGIVSNYPPLDFKDPATGKLTGFDVELGEALAAKLGTTVKWQETSFDQMMSSLATGRIDIILSAMTDLPARRDTVKFINYLKTGPHFYVIKGRAAELANMVSMCGKKVGASRRTAFPADIAKWSDENCVKAGKPPIVVTGTDGSADARTQLRQGRLDAAVQGGETLPYLMKQEPNTYAPIGRPLVIQYIGLGVTRKDDALASELSGALGSLIADGSYAKIVEKWGLQDYAVSKVIIDSAE